MFRKNNYILDQKKPINNGENMAEWPNITHWVSGLYLLLVMVDAFIVYGECRAETLATSDITVLIILISVFLTFFWRSIWIFKRQREGYTPVCKDGFVPENSALLGFGLLFAVAVPYIIVPHGQAVESSSASVWISTLFLLFPLHSAYALHRGKLQAGKSGDGAISDGRDEHKTPFSGGVVAWPDKP